MIATPPDIIELTPEMKKRLDDFEEAHKDEPIGNVGGRIILEDDKVKYYMFSNMQSDAFGGMDQSQNLSEHELNAYLADKVAKWWLPERWAFIDEIPKTSVGKFDKKVLRARHADDGLEVETLG